MGLNVIITGTGYNNSDGSSRAAIIREYCKKGMPVNLIREPMNPYDTNAIAVFITFPKILGLLEQSQLQIGYIKTARAKTLGKKMDSGTRLSGIVESFFAPLDMNWPRVSLCIEYHDA